MAPDVDDHGVLRPRQPAGVNKGGRCKCGGRSGLWRSSAVGRTSLSFSLHSPLPLTPSPAFCFPHFRTQSTAAISIHSPPRPLPPSPLLQDAIDRGHFYSLPPPLPCCRMPLTGATSASTAPMWRRDPTWRRYWPLQPRWPLLSASCTRPTWCTGICRVRGGGRGGGRAGVSG